MQPCRGLHSARMILSHLIFLNHLTQTSKLFKSRSNYKGLTLKVKHKFLNEVSPYAHVSTVYLSLRCVCVCVCVWEWERWRAESEIVCVCECVYERETDRQRMTLCVCAVVCVCARVREMWIVMKWAFFSFKSEAKNRKSRISPQMLFTEIFSRRLFPMNYFLCRKKTGFSYLHIRSRLKVKVKSPFKSKEFKDTMKLGYNELGYSDN